MFGSKNSIKLSLGEQILSICNYLFFFIIAFLMLAPLLNLIAKSVSLETDILTGEVGLLPNFSRIQFDTYKLVLKNSLFIRGFINTFLVTVIGTTVAVIVTASAAYSLSKPYLQGRKQLILLCIFIMIFSGGLIPTYLVVTSLKLINTFTILWITSVFAVYNMLITKNFFESIPVDLEESATIDGAGHFLIFFKIYIPLSKSVFAVIALFYAVGYWNNFFTALIYTTKPQLKTLQLVLKEIIYSVSDIFLSLFGGQSVGEITAQSTIAACVVIATIPIVLVYPYMQRYFVKGVMIGSVKG